jgi:DNA-nicking Smr family endonuclease
MARRPRNLTENDIAYWAHFAQHVRPLPGRARPHLPPQHMPTQPAPRPAPSAPALRPAQHNALVTGFQPPGLDNATWNRFREGKLPAVRTLDLHGKTAQSAYHALERFLHAAHADHLRCVEIVTGRGKGESGGVIRRELPLWLNLPSLRHLVLAASHPGGSHARPANTGATRLLLRRPR